MLWSISGGVIIFVLGVFIFLKPDLVWKLTEAWKSYRAAEYQTHEKTKPVVMFPMPYRHKAGIPHHFFSLVLTSQFHHNSEACER